MLRSRAWILGLATWAVEACGPSGPSDDTQVQVIRANVHDVSPPLSELAKLPVPDTFELHVHEAEPLRPIPHMRLQSAVQQPDPVVQNAIGGPNIPSSTVNFEGMGAGMVGFVLDSAPPDTDGDIGPNHYVQIVNEGVTVFSRTGTKLLGPIPTKNLWMDTSGMSSFQPCDTTDDGDGVVRYDRIADRWVIAQFSVNQGIGPFFECIAVSTTPDPTGSYYRYKFQFDNFPDYPKMALWPDAYYFSFNMFTTTTFAGARVCAFDRMKMLAGAVATMQCFNTAPSFGGLLASDLDGPTLPPTGSPNFLVALDTTALDFWKFHVDFAIPTNSTFTGPTTIPVAAYTPLCHGGTCVVQPNTTNKLESLADRLMNRLVYRNFADHEALLVSHAVTAGTGGGVRWYELRNPATIPRIFQQGTYAPDSAFRWMSSMAFDSAGNIGLGFSISSSTINPGIRYTGRLVTDAPGIMGQGEATIIAGTGSQTGALTRWGDYSSMNIDPADDCTFWYTQEYMVNSGTFNWHTHIGAFTFKFNNILTATGLPLAIPDNFADGITSSIPVTSIGNVMSLSLSLNITHPFRHDLVVKLTSPDGTVFFVSSRQSGASDIIFTNLPVTAFNGHTATGTWQLNVADLELTNTGALNSWSMTIVGNCKPTVHWSGSATPNRPTSDNGTVCTDLTVSTTGGDSSVAKLDISGSHDYRSVLRGTLTHNSVMVDAFPTGTFPSGSGTFSFTNRPVPGLSGDSSGTWTLCITDTDAFGDTGVINTWSVHD